MLRRGTLLVVLALLCTAPTARAAGRWVIGLNGGWTFPTGDYGSIDSSGVGARSGPQFGMEVGYLVTDRIVLGLDGGWLGQATAYEGQAVDVGGGETLVNVKDLYQIARVAAFAKFLVPIENSSIRPYGILGIGAYNPTHDYDYMFEDSLGVQIDRFTDEIDNADQPGWRVGARIGAGVLFRASEPIGIDLRGDFHFISIDESKFLISSIQYIGVQVGIVYSFRSR